MTKEIEAAVIRHDLPMHLPGYIRVVLRAADGAEFALTVIEIEATERHFAVGNVVTIAHTAGAPRGDEYATSWQLGSQQRTQRVARL